MECYILYKVRIKRDKICSRIPSLRNPSKRRTEEEYRKKEDGEEVQGSGGKDGRNDEVNRIGTGDTPAVTEHKNEDSTGGLTGVTSKNFETGTESRRVSDRLRGVSVTGRRTVSPGVDPSGRLEAGGVPVDEGSETARNLSRGSYRSV